MKYIIDTDKLPCNNGKNCTTCPFWSMDDTCEITEQVKKLPKYEERQRGEWEKKSLHSEYFYCSKCKYAYRHDFNFCPNCGTPMTEKALEILCKREGEAE